MRRKYGTIFIALVLLLTFQILILDESSAQQNGGSYGPAPKLSQFHRIGTSIRANSIRQEAEDPQVTSPQYLFNPNSYSYGPAEYYDPYRPVAGDPSVYDFNSGPPYNDPSLANSYYDDPTSYTYTGYNDPGTLGPNANPIYFDPEASTDPSYGSSGYTESDDSENADDSQSGGGVMSAMRDMLSGMDMNSATGLLGAIGNMMASQGSIANSANPLQAVSTAGTVANAAGTLASAASTGTPAASTFSAEGIDADIPTSPSNSAAFGTDSLSNLNSTLDVETTKNSQNPNYVDNVWAASDEVSHTDPTPQNPNTLWDVEGQSSKPVGLDSKTKNKLDVIVNNPHSITPRNPDKVASLWDAVNYFNSQSENSGKSNPMLIFTPVDLDRMKSQKDDYEPVLTDGEIAKLYNSLGKKKIKSVLLLTDSNVDTPYELFDEINPPVLEETGGTEHIINKLGDQYHFIPLSDESAKKLIPLISLPLNLETTSKDEVSNLFKSQIMDNYEDVLKQIEDYYGIVLKEQESTSKTTPDIGVNSTAGENVYTSARVRKDNEDFMKEMDKFYEFIPAGMDLSQKQSTEIAPHSKLKEQSLMDIDSSRVSNNSLVSEKYDGNMPVQSDLKSTKLSGGLVNREVMPIFLLTDDAENILKKLNHSQPFKRESDDLIETLSEFYKFEPVGVGSPGHSGFDEMMFLPENKKSNENNFDTFGKHNQDIINSLSKYYEYIPSGRNYLSDQEPSNKNNTERVKKHNNDIIKSISNFYDLIPLKELADETAPGENIYSSGQETSNKNNSGIVEKHNNDTESINDFYEYIPSKKMADVKAPGTKIYSSDQEISNNNGRVKKHNNDIIEPMSNFYELIPLKELLADQAAPETNIYSYDQEISNKNDSERVRKDNNDMIRSMSNFYDSLPTGIDSFKRPSPAIHPQSIINDDQSAIGFSNGNDIIEAHDVNGIMDSIRNNEISTSTPRIYRMIPKIRTFTRSGIEVKNNYFLEDLRSKLGSEFNIDDKLLVINNGIGNGKEYFLAKERTKSSGEKLSRENGGFLPKTSESSQKPCQTSHIICEQKPSKYIFRFTCYDPESYHNHTGNQCLILHFDCLNKISPIITNILKNVDNHHSASSGCSTSNICENKSHPDSSSGESYAKDWKSSPDVINHNPVYSTDANVSPVPINPGNRGGSSIDYHDFKSSTENSYTELSVPEETSFKNCEVYQSEKYAKSNSDTSDVYDSTKIESYSQPANRLSSQSSQPLNYPDKTPSYAAVQNMESKLNFNDVKTLSASQQDFKQEKYQSEPDTASKLTNSDSYDSSNDSIVLSVDSIPYSGSHENLGISSRPFIPDKGSSSCNSQLETQPPFYQNTQQSSPDTTLDNGFRNSVYDSPQEPMMEKGRNSIMTISKSDKQKYADKLKNSVLEQGGRIENSTCVIDNHISEAIETLLNNSLQPCSKVEEILPCHPSTGSINSNKPSAPIIKPLCPVNINGAVNSDDSTIPVQQCLEIPKCHLEECVSTKHTQKILKHQDSTKLVHGFECKKTIQSNVCGDNIGPCNLRSDCKISLPSSCKECETLANFLDKISQTLDKNINSCKEKENK